MPPTDASKVGKPVLDVLFGRVDKMPDRMLVKTIKVLSEGGELDLTAGLLEAVKHARAYLRGKGTRQTEQEGE